MNSKPKSIVITGSTRGIGYSMADAFLERGCNVTISGRKQEAVDVAVAKLSVKHNREQIYGVPCDVTDFIQVEEAVGECKRSFQYHRYMDQQCRNGSTHDEVLGANTLAVRRSSADQRDWDDVWDQGCPGRDDGAGWWGAL